MKEAKIEILKERLFIAGSGALLHALINRRDLLSCQRRWLVERTFGWFNWCRRLSKDYEILPETTEAFIYVAMIRLMLKQLA